MKKIGNSVMAIPFGILFIIVGVFILAWNEGNNVKNIKTTNEALKEYINVNSDAVDSSNEGKLVATNGTLTLLGNDIVDNEFNVKMKTAKLVRKVEMYQWKEEEKTDENDNTIKTYKRLWSEDLISSASYEGGYVNPENMPYENRSYIANNVKIGAFSLTDNQIDQLTTPNIINLQNDTVIPTGYHIINNYITNTENLDNPEVGDVRISFLYNDDKEVSVLAVQQNDTFSTYRSESGGEINRIEPGTYNGAEMIAHIQNEDKVNKWLFRGVGLVLIILGFSAVLGPISAVTSFVPVFGRLVGNVIGLISTLLGLCLSLLIIAIFWFAFRPLLSIILLALVFGLIFLISNIVKKNKNNLMPANNQAMPNPNNIVDNQNIPNNLK